MRREEDFVGEQIRDALEQPGVTVLTGRRAVSTCRDGPQITTILEDGARFTGDRLLVAIGCTPLTEVADFLHAATFAIVARCH